MAKKKKADSKLKSLSDLRKKYKSETNKKIQRWKLESPKLNYLFGGGLPKGRIIEFIGKESIGKSSLAQIILGSVQRNYEDINSAVIDMEHTFDYDYATNLGMVCDDDNFGLFVPESGEDAFDFLVDAAKNKLLDVAIIDSVSALTPQAEHEGEMGDANMGLQARLMSKGFRKTVNYFDTANFTTIFINQIRMKIGVMFGNPETTSGGNALKFYSSIRCKILKGTDHEIKNENGEQIGIRIKIRAFKNKTAPPNREVEVSFYYDKGLDIIEEYVDLAADFKIIERSGSWYSYKDEKLGQGISNVKGFITQNKELYDEIKNLVDIEIDKKNNISIIKDLTEEQDDSKSE